MLNCLQFFFVLYSLLALVEWEERKKNVSKINDNNNGKKNFVSSETSRFCGIGSEMVNVYTYLRQTKTDREKQHEAEKKGCTFFICLHDSRVQFVFKQMASVFENKHLLFGCFACKHELMKCTLLYFISTILYVYAYYCARCLRTLCAFPSSQEFG